MRNFVIFIFKYEDDKNKEEEMNGTLSMHGGDEKCM
jgi:hypothetical protein